MSTIGLRILVVDDEPDHRELIRDALEHHYPGLQVREASTAAEAIGELASGQYDVILVDYILPDHTALEILPELVQTAPSTPVIVLTAYGDEEIAVASLRGGAADYVVKSAGLAQQLPRAVDSALQAARLRREAQLAQERIAHLNSVLLAIRNVNQLITQVHDREELLRRACQTLTETRGYGAAWVIVTDGSTVRGGHQSGLEAHFDTFLADLKQGEFPPCLTTVLQHPDQVAAVPPETAHENCALSPVHHGLGVLATALKHRDSLYGALFVALPEVLLDDPEEQALFAEVCCDLSLALHTVDSEMRRHIAENELRQSEETFRKLVESAPVGIAIRRGLDLLYVNPRMLQVLGYESQDQIPGNSVLSLYPPEDRDHLAERMLRRDRGEPTATSYDIVCITRQGERRTHQINVAVIHLPDGPAAIGFHTDIQERIALEQDLRRQIIERQQAEQQLLAQQGELRSLATEISLAEERERRRVATQLHDTVVQFLAFAKLKMGLLQQKVEDQEVKPILADVEGLLQDALSRSRAVMYELSSSALYEIGLEEAMKTLVGQYQEQYDLPLSFHDDGQPKPLDMELQIVLFQSLRELLTNMLDHEGLTSAEVRIARDEGFVKLTVSDNGSAVAPAETQTGGDERRRLAMLSIRERLRYFSGALQIEARPGEGTTVTLLAPVQA